MLRYGWTLKTYFKWNKLDTKIFYNQINFINKQILYNPTKVFRAVKLLESQSMILASRSQGREDRDLLFNFYRVLYKIKSSMINGTVCIRMSIYLISLN